MVNDSKEMRELREKNRVNDILHLSKANNGKIKTIKLAEMWQIHPEQVKTYFEYLLRKYQIPVNSVEQGYPTYYIGGNTKYQFYEVDITDKVVKEEDLIYPDANSKKHEQIERCPNCGRRTNGEQYCGQCGYDLTAAK